MERHYGKERLRAQPGTEAQPARVTELAAPGRYVRGAQRSRMVLQMLEAAEAAHGRPRDTRDPPGTPLLMEVAPPPESRPMAELIAELAERETRGAQEGHRRRDATAASTEQRLRENRQRYLSRQQQKQPQEDPASPELQSPGSAEPEPEVPAAAPVPEWCEKCSYRTDRCKCAWMKAK